MPQLNELGEYGLNTLLARRLTTPGPAPSPTVEPAIFPALVLESDRLEFGYSKGERLGAARAAVGAVAAQFSFAALTNPANSGLIVTVTRVRVTPGNSAGLLRLGYMAAFAAPVTTGVRDGRWIQTGTTTARCQAEMNAGTKGALNLETAIGWSNNNVATEFDAGYVIRPGQGLLYELATANIALSDVTFEWRERAGQPGEL